jgi:hypothetical protein
MKNKEKKDKTKYFYKQELEIPLYRGSLFIIFTNDKKHLKKEVPDFGGGELYAHALRTSINKHMAFVVVLNFDNKTRKIYHGCISHETMHLVDYITEARGWQFTELNNEPAAYLGEWIADQIYIFANDCNLEILINDEQ